MIWDNRLFPRKIEKNKAKETRIKAVFIIK
jgi:hypothetical protein